MLYHLLLGMKEVLKNELFTYVCHISNIKIKNVIMILILQHYNSSCYNNKKDVSKNIVLPGFEPGTSLTLGEYSPPSIH